MYVKQVKKNCLLTHINGSKENKGVGCILKSEVQSGVRKSLAAFSHQLPKMTGSYNKIRLN